RTTSDRFAYSAVVAVAHEHAQAGAVGRTNRAANTTGTSSSARFTPVGRIPPVCRSRTSGSAVDGPLRGTHRPGVRRGAGRPCGGPDPRGRPVRGGALEHREGRVDL